MTLMTKHQHVTISLRKYYKLKVFLFCFVFLTAMTTCFSVNGSLFITFKFPIDHGEGPHMNVAVCFYSPLVMSGETQQG